MAKAPAQREWEIEFTPQAKAWLRSLSPEDFVRIERPLNQLRQHGPTLGRPCAESIKGSRYRNMKELRSAGQHLRALFVFDPRRRAVVLLGGDKCNDWDRWYDRNIPVADKLYDQHLRALGREVQWQNRATRVGKRSAANSR